MPTTPEALPAPTMPIEQIRVGAQAPYQLLPDLAVDDYEALKADIAVRGVQVPLELDEQGQVLDGHQRKRAWEALRAAGAKIPDYPRTIRLGLSEDEKFEHALVLNLQRRHLTTEQRRELTLKLRERGWSTTRIAEVERVNDRTVRRDVAAEPGSANAEPDRVVGRDGKSYPARRPTSVHATSERQAQRVLDALPLAAGALPEGAVDPKRVERIARDISGLYVTWLHPERSAPRWMAPQEYFDLLWSFRSSPLQASADRLADRLGALVAAMEQSAIEYEDVLAALKGLLRRMGEGLL